MAGLKGEVHERVGIPEDSIIEVDIEIVGFFNSEGRLALAYGCDGDVPVSTIAGLLEQTKHVVLNRWDRNSDTEVEVDDD